MDKTQLQLRIEASVTKNTSYPINTYFIDLGRYRKRPFSNESPLEDDIKTGETLKDIRPAVQARLAHMDFCEIFCDIVNRYKNSNFILRTYANIKIRGIQIRNNYLMGKVMIKAMIKTIRRKSLLNLLDKNLHPVLIHEIYNLLDNKKDLVDK